MYDSTFFVGLQRRALGVVLGVCVGAAVVPAGAAKRAPASYGPERMLAGIAIGRPAVQVLKKYGNPTRVQATSFTPAMDPNAGGMMPGATGGLPSPSSFGLPAMPGMPSASPGIEAPPSPTSLGGALGNMGGLFGPQPAAPGGTGFEGTGGFPGMTGQAPVEIRPITKYFYDYASGPSLVFTVGQKGLVEQIDAFAPWPWSPARTQRGINVGSSYSSVVARYGYPQEQRNNSDGTLFMNYAEKAHVAFTVLAGKVVGVSVALVE